MDGRTMMERPSFIINYAQMIAESLVFKVCVSEFEKNVLPLRHKQKCLV